MRRNQVLQSMVIVLLLLSVVFVYTATADAPSESQVDATITCTFDTGSRLTVRAQMIVNSIENVYETTYTRQMIEATTDTDVLAVIKNQIHVSMKNQLEKTFYNADVTAITKKPTYEKPYFIDDFRVNLTAAFFQYHGSMNITNFINGVLDMGAKVTYHFNLQVQQGWNATYRYVLPSAMTLPLANTSNTDFNTNSATWMVQNWTGKEEKKEATLQLQSKNPTTSASQSEDIGFQFIMDTRTVRPISFTESIVLKKMSLQRYLVLPEFITELGSIPADGVRLFIDSGLFSWTDLFEKTIQPIEQHTTPLLENLSLKQKLRLSFSWDAESTTNCSTPYNITHMDDEPAIQATFIDPDVQLQICQMPARAFFGLLNAGATATVSSEDVNFVSGLEGTYTNVLRLPANITLDGDNVYTWNKTKSLAGVFSSDRTPTAPYQEEHIETRVEIEFTKMDLNIPSVFTGKTELSASTKIKEDERLYVIRQLPELSFSEKVNVTFLNADALRLCIEENVFDDSQQNIFLSGRTEVFQQRLSEMFHGKEIKGMVDRKVLSNSLAWDGDISAMDDIVPVVISNTASEVYTVGFNVSLWPAELTIAPQQFALRSIENQTVTYRIVFPRGITVNASDSLEKTIIIGKTSGGNDYVELSFEPQSVAQTTILTCSFTVSPVYVLGIFLPCILVLILLIVLVVIIFLIRKKKGGLRKGKRKLFEPEDNEPSEYVEQEYYIPPPPPSTKKKK